MGNFFTSIFGGGNTAAGYAKTQNDLIGRNTALVGSLNDAYNTAMRSGAYDPNAALDNLRNDTAYQTKVNTGNAAANALTMGYRPGDTAPLQAQDEINQRSQLAYADEANGIRTNAAQAGYGAATSLANASSNIYGQSLGANGQMLNYAQNQDNRQGAFLGNLLNTGMSFLNPAKAAMGAVGGFGTGRTNPYMTNAPGTYLRGTSTPGFSL